MILGLAIGIYYWISRNRYRNFRIIFSKISFLTNQFLFIIIKWLVICKIYITAKINQKQTYFTSYVIRRRIVRLLLRLCHMLPCLLLRPHCTRRERCFDQWRSLRMLPSHQLLLRILRKKKHFQEAWRACGRLQRLLCSMLLQCMFNMSEPKSPQAKLIEQESRTTRNHLITWHLVNNKDITNHYSYHSNLNGNQESSLFLKE